jgi:hypothetical protein
MVRNEDISLYVYAYKGLRIALRPVIFRYILSHVLVAETAKQRLRKQISTEKLFTEPLLSNSLRKYATICFR